MKTTVDIADDLLLRAKALAAGRGTTLRDVLEQGLRAVLADSGQAGRFVLEDRSVNGQGLQAEFRDQPWSRLLDAAYEGRGV